MKRYALFAGDTYYPGGGWDDFRQAFDSPEEAREWFLHNPHDWYQIIDLKTGEPA